jgi:hypothetical protein
VKCKKHCQELFFERYKFYICAEFGIFTAETSWRFSLVINLTLIFFAFRLVAVLPMDRKHTVSKKYPNLPQTNISKCIRYTTLCGSIERLAANYVAAF